MSTLKGAQVKATAEISLTVSATNGDRQRLKEIIEYVFRTMYPLLVAMALKITNYDQELAEEILSITLTKLLTRNPKLPSEDIMKNGYLKKCIRNNYYRYLEKRKETAELLPDELVFPEDELDLEEMLAPLPEHLRECIRLFAYDYSENSIAEKLNTTVHYVRQFKEEGFQLVKEAMK